LIKKKEQKKDATGFHKLSPRLFLTGHYNYDQPACLAVVNKNIKERRERQNSQKNGRKESFYFSGEKSF
jgi:hypothetical protein